MRNIIVKTAGAGIMVVGQHSTGWFFRHRRKKFSVARVGRRLGKTNEVYPLRPAPRFTALRTHCSQSPTTCRHTMLVVTSPYTAHTSFD